MWKVIKSLITNLRLRGLKDILNPRKWKVFLLSKLRGLDLPAEEAFARAEQVVYRSRVCSECVGECVHCGCPVPAAFLEPDNICSALQWEEMLSAEDWAKFKKDGGIDLTIKFE